MLVLVVKFSVSYYRWYINQLVLIMLHKNKDPDGRYHQTFIFFFFLLFLIEV